MQGRNEGDPGQTSGEAVEGSFDSRQIVLDRLPSLSGFCFRCGLRVERVPWAGKWERVTQALAQAIALLAKKLSLKEVAEHFELDWKVVATVVKRVVQEGLKLRRVKTLHILGIDEVSRKKGHSYLTVVYDLERGRLLWVGLDRNRRPSTSSFDGWGNEESEPFRLFAWICGLRI